MRLFSVCALVALMSAACSTAPAADPSPSVSVVQGAGQEGGVSAQEVVDALGERFELPSPRENTGFCEESGCLQLVTTDPVTIVQFPGPGKAKAYAEAFGRPTVAVGAIVVSYAGRSGEELWPAKRRRALVSEVRRIVADR